MSANPSLPLATPDLQAAVLPVEPFIYTKNGNVPLSHLHYSHAWSDDADATMFIEEYRVRDVDGEVVKRSVHVMSKKGLTGEALPGAPA